MASAIAFFPDTNQKSGINKELEEEFRNIIVNGLIFTKFQPIVCLTTGDVVAYEALSRGPEASMFENPVYLFEVAEKLEMLEDLDMLCREKAVMNAKKLGLNTKPVKLFINIDAACIAYTKHDKGKTKAFIEEFEFEMDNIVLEITERTFIKDSKIFYQALSHYQSQGFLIAIDDLGSGSAGLRLISEINPQKVKIDKFLVENIDKSFKKQAIVKMLVEMCHRVLNSKIVAEGIETFDEYTTIKMLGIDWGQGYLFGKPSSTLQSVPAYIKNKIILHPHVHNEKVFSDETGVESMVSVNAPIFHSTTKVGKLVETFNQHSEVLGIPIVNDGIPVGLVMKTRLFSRLSRKFGFELFYNRPVSCVMDTAFLAVDKNQDVDSVAKQALSRGFPMLYDIITVTDGNKYYGVSTVHALLERMTILKIKHATQSNPLTGLPGNVSIRAFVEKQIMAAQDFACVYFDLDHFKAYNDYYGFCKGDEVIKKTGYLIMEIFVVSRIGFVGHIGGDDFIALIHPEEIQELCARFIREFDAMVPTFYAETDIKNGYIETLDRKNEKCKFPLMSISLAVVESNENSRFHSFLELGKVAAEIKKKAKTMKGSVFLIDQRKQAEGT
jgi:diguanylate cyclase (GGDEF)-like protein